MIRCAARQHARQGPEKRAAGLRRQTSGRSPRVRRGYGGPVTDARQVSGHAARLAGRKRSRVTTRRRFAPAWRRSTTRLSASTPSHRCRPKCRGRTPGSAEGRYGGRPQAAPGDCMHVNSLHALPCVSGSLHALPCVSGSLREKPGPAACPRTKAINGSAESEPALRPEPALPHIETDRQSGSDWEGAGRWLQGRLGLLGGQHNTMMIVGRPQLVAADDKHDEDGCEA